VAVNKARRLLRLIHEGKRVRARKKGKFLVDALKPRFFCNLPPEEEGGGKEGGRGGEEGTGY